MIYEFRDPFEVSIEVGKGRALFVESTGHDYYWTIALENCAIVTVPQNQVRICRSYTHSRNISHDEMIKLINA